MKLLPSNFQYSFYLSFHESGEGQFTMWKESEIANTKTKITKNENDLHNDSMQHA